MDDSISKPTGNDTNVDEPDHVTLNEVDVEDDIDNESVELNKRRDKRITSDCWKYLIRIGIGDDGKERARCNGCNQKYKIGKMALLI